MSRSYAKSYRCDPLWHTSIWDSFRIQEQRCINKEMNALISGDVVFPKYCNIQGQRGDCSVKYERNRVTKKYAKEISDILNGGIFYKWNGIRVTLCRSDLGFLEDVQQIRKNKIPYFEWLKQREVKKLVKAWEGNIFDVLYHLSRRGYIKKAAEFEQKRWFRRCK